MHKFQYLHGVVTLDLNATLCKGCGMCTIVCPHKVFKMQNGKAMIQDLNACMECGACSRNCAYGAISVRSGVGCAAGILNGLIRGTEASCDCSGNKGQACC